MIGKVISSLSVKDEFSRLRQALTEHDYSVEAIGFDGVPATGGSFRCASLALKREN